MLAEGATLLHIRATTIHDTLLVSAIQKGARTRRIHILLDQPSTEIKALLGRPNVQVRLTRAARRGKIGKAKLSQSFVMEIGKGYYETWYGPRIWTKQAFGSHFQFYDESGDGPGETAPQQARTFNRDFAASVLLKLPQRSGMKSEGAGAIKRQHHHFSTGK